MVFRVSQNACSYTRSSEPGRGVSLWPLGPAPDSVTEAAAAVADMTRPSVVMRCRIPLCRYRQMRGTTLTAAATTTTRLAAATTK